MGSRLSPEMLSVHDDRALKAAVLAMKAADRDLRSAINKATRETMNPVWRSLVQENATRAGGLAARMLGPGARIAAGNPPVAKAAQSSRKVGRAGSLTPADDYGPWEFGVQRRERFVTYDRTSPKGGRHKVRRRVLRGLPPAVRGGRVIYPAWSELAPRLVSLWVQLIVRKYHEAAEKGG